MTVEDLYTKACDAVERANYDYAVELFREVLRQNPEYPDARAALRGTERRRAQEKGRSAFGALGAPVRALATALKGRFAKARKRLEVYEDYLEKSPSSFWALTKAAAAARKAGLRGEAIQVYRDALKLKPSSQKVLRALGDLLVEAAEHQEALKYLTRLSSLRPHDRDLDKEVRDLAATDHMVAHDMAGATSFRDMIRDTDEAARLEADGRMAVTTADLLERVATAEEELAEHPDNVTRILGLARLYQDTGQLGKAQKLLRQQNQQMPDNYEIREHLGDVQLRVYDEAIERAAAAAAQNPDDAEAAGKKEDLTARKRQFALREYNWRLEQHPSDRELQLHLGRLHFEAGDHNEAIAAFQGAAQDARYELESCRMLGLCFMGKGQHDLALEQFERALKRHPDMDEQGKELRYDQAQAYEQMGNKEEALNLYKRIYSQDINFRDVARKVDALSE